MVLQTTVKTLLRTVSVAGGRGERRQGELKENTGTETRETNNETVRQATTVVGGRDKKEKTNTKKRWQNTQSRDGGEVPS